MLGVLIFSVVLVIAVLISDVAHRSILSTAVLFLVAGVIVGSTTGDEASISPDQPVVTHVAELALFTILFTDGMRIGLREFSSAWHLPGRALLLGLPLTLVIIAALARFVAGLPWGPSLLVGAVLSPTDPVFAAAIVGREGVPQRLRRLLNVESGLNDGLALPVVLIVLALLRRSSPELGELLGELLLGIAIGILVPWVILQLEKAPLLSPAPGLAPLFPFAIGLLVFALTGVLNGNAFLGAFSAGATVATLNERFREEFHRFGQLLSELLKLAAILVFGAFVSLNFLAGIGVGGYGFALLTLLVARPLALGISLVGSDLPRREWIAAAWFGPKGFASVVYGLLVLQSPLARAEELFHLIALVVVASIILHSSTDVVVASRFEDLQVPARDP